MSFDSSGLVASAERQQAVAANLNCCFCNHLQFIPNFSAPQTRKPVTANKTTIQGNPDDYFITIPTRYLLRDGWGPRDDQTLQDCRYCRFLHDTLNLFFRDSSMDWIEDSRNGWDGVVVAHAKTDSPLVLHCQRVVNCGGEWINLRADIEVFCHDRSALSTSDFPSMYLALPEQEEIVDDLDFKSFMNSSMQNCRIAGDRIGGRYVVPNRLLHIDWDTQEIKLHCPPRLPLVVPGVPDMVAYGTLSHCWSETDPKLPRLLKSNIQDWMGGVRIQSLPPAIQDAAEVAYTNNIHYLWIESLCVFQDDEMDSRLQKPFIGAYFRDSAFTIVAASSTSPSEAFLYPLREDWVTKQIEFTAPSGGTANINLRKRYSRQVSPLDAIDELTYKSKSKSFQRVGPLYRQQRCYQEALLASRVISFTSAAITVNCRRHKQCTPDFFPGYKRDNIFNSLISPRINWFDGMRHAVPGRENTTMWLQAVMQYTARDMTVSPKNKLSGIAGLASMTSMAQTELYFLGLWMNKIHEGLLWEVRLRPRQTSATRITFPFKDQKAPTFSWASVDAAIHYPELWSGRFVPTAAIKEACTMNEAQGTFGDVEGGFLKLRGRLIRCEVSQTLSGPTAGAKGKLSVAYFDMKGKEDDVDIPKPKGVPFVADGPLLMVKNRKWSRDHSRKEAVCANCACCKANNRSLVSELVTCSWRTVIYLTRNHCGFRKKTPKHGQKKISGTAYVLCLGWRETGATTNDPNQRGRRSYEGLVVTPSLRYLGAFERIGCIRNIPAAAYEECEDGTITLV